MFLRLMHVSYAVLVCSIGNPSRNDPTHYKTVNTLFYPRPKRMHQDPNPQIAAEKNRWNHRALTFLQPDTGKGKARLRVVVSQGEAPPPFIKTKVTVPVEPKWA